jgi:5-methylcytosine-specific restriction enzyme A
VRRLKNLPPMLGRQQVKIVGAEPKRADPYYHSAAHQQWRRAVIERAAGRCQDRQCQTPARTGIRLFADHVVELRDGGSPTDLGNGLARCGACHTRKTAAARAARMARPT